MRRAAVALSATLGALVLACVGFWFGFREGVNVGLWLDSAPRAAIGLRHIEAIQAGRASNTLVLLESEIDSALLWAYRFEQHPLSPVVEAVWGLPVSFRIEYLQRLANYRQTNPSPMRADALNVDPATGPADERQFAQCLLDGARENDKVIALMVEKYGTRSRQ